MSVLCWLGILVTNWPWLALGLLILLASLSSTRQKHEQLAKDANTSEAQKTTFVAPPSALSKSRSPIKSITLLNQAGEKVSFKAVGEGEEFSIEGKHKKILEAKDKQIAMLRSEVGQLKSAQIFDNEEREEELQELRERLRQTEDERPVRDEILQQRLGELLSLQTKHDDAIAAVAVVERELNALQVKLRTMEEGEIASETALKRQIQVVQDFRLRFDNAVAVAAAAENKAAELEKNLENANKSIRCYNAEASGAGQHQIVTENELRRAKEALEAFAALQNTLEKAVTDLEHVTLKFVREKEVDQEDLKVLQEQGKVIFQVVQELNEVKDSFEVVAAECNGYYNALVFEREWNANFQDILRGLSLDLKQSLIERSKVLVQQRDAETDCNRCEARLAAMKKDRDREHVRRVELEGEKSRFETEYRDAMIIVRTAFEEQKASEAQIRQLSRALSDCRKKQNGSPNTLEDAVTEKDDQSEIETAESHSAEESPSKLKLLEAKNRQLNALLNDKNHEIVDYRADEKRLRLHLSATLQVDGVGLNGADMEISKTNSNERSEDWIQSLPDVMDPVTEVDLEGLDVPELLGDADADEQSILLGQLDGAPLNPSTASPSETSNNDYRNKSNSQSRTTESLPADADTFERFPDIDIDPSVLYQNIDELKGQSIEDRKPSTAVGGGPILLPPDIPLSHLQEHPDFGHLPEFVCTQAKWDSMNQEQRIRLIVDAGPLVTTLLEFHTLRKHRTCVYCGSADHTAPSRCAIWIRLNREGRCEGCYQALKGVKGHAVKSAGANRCAMYGVLELKKGWVTRRLGESSVGGGSTATSLVTTPSGVMTRGKSIRGHMDARGLSLVTSPLRPRPQSRQWNTRGEDARKEEDDDDDDAEDERYE